MVATSWSWPNTPAGTYEVVLTDSHECTTSASVILQGLPLLTATAEWSEPTCYGQHGSITISATGGTGVYQYKINVTEFSSSAVINNLASGGYGWEVLDSNTCSVSGVLACPQPLQVHVFTIPLALSDVQTTSDFRVSSPGTSDGVVYVDGVDGFLPYTFSLGASDIESESSSTTISGVSVGSYTITLTDSHGCIATNTTIVHSPTAPSPPSYLGLQVIADQNLIILSWDGRPFDGYSDLVSFVVQAGEFNEYAGDVEWVAPVTVLAPIATYSFKYASHSASFLAIFSCLYLIYIYFQVFLRLDILFPSGSSKLYWH